MALKRTFWLNIWLSAAAWASAASTPDQVIEQLADQLREQITAPRFARSMWGIKVISLESGRVWFDWNGGKLMKPASNAKLYSGALALHTFGPDYRFRTTFFREGPLSSGGVLDGNLIVYGRGDPSFAARFNDGHYELSLAPLVQALKETGLHRVNGDLVGDESYFRGPPYGHGWTWDDLQYYYGAEVSALTVDDNVVDLRLRPGGRIGAPCRIEGRPSASYLVWSNRTCTVAAEGRSRIDVARPVASRVVYVTGQLPLDSEAVDEAVTVPAPAHWFVLLLKEAMAREGIEVTGQVRTIDWLDRDRRPVEVERWTELAEIEGRSLEEVLARMMKPSQNLYAHLLLLGVGAAGQAEDPYLALQSTEAAGLAELRSFLGQAGIEENEVFLEEGSGLSRGGLVTPNATVSLLRYMDRHPWGKVFRDALPVAGKDGTLRRRLVGTAAEGKVRAKTGTLRFVNTLSGYAQAGNGERLAFSLMLNNHQGDRSGRAELDEIVKLMLVAASAPEER